MAAPKGVKNPLEAAVYDYADDYVDLVLELVDEFAPFSPWWTAILTPDQQLWRYLEVRGPIVTWLSEVGVWMGYKSWDDTLAHLEEIWFGHKLVDMVPPEVIDQRPIALVELVQSNPRDAAKHIRDMERLVAKRQAGAQALAAAKGEPSTATEASNPPLEPAPPELPEKTQPL